MSAVRAVIYVPDSLSSITLEFGSDEDREISPVSRISMSQKMALILRDMILKEFPLEKYPPVITDAGV